MWSPFGPLKRKTMESHFAFRSAFFYAKGRNFGSPKIVITPEAFARDHYLAYINYISGFDSNYKCIENYYKEYINSLYVCEELVNSS